MSGLFFANILFFCSALLAAEKPWKGLPDSLPSNYLEQNQFKRNTNARNLNVATSLSFGNTLEIFLHGASQPLPREKAYDVLTQDLWSREAPNSELVHRFSIGEDRILQLRLMRKNLSTKWAFGIYEPNYDGSKLILQKHVLDEARSLVVDHPRFGLLRINYHLLPYTRQHIEDFAPFREHVFSAQRKPQNFIPR
jgi:hypothetical protein